ncbi:MAG: hypothetical protein ACOC1X_00280 [Promethearchaeota archaeon]
MEIIEDFKNCETKGGYFSHKIVLYEKSTSTLFHELGHHITDKILRLNYERAKSEILSEINTFIITKKFNPLLKFNYNYSNCWSNLLPKEYTPAEFEKDYNLIEKFVTSLNFPNPSK